MNDEKINFDETMIDLETLGQKTSSAFISIGMVRFDLNTCIVDHDSYFYRNIRWEDAMKYRSFDVSTLQFWLTQNEDASKVLLKDQKPLDSVGIEVRSYLQKGKKVWGNGSNFDISILDNYFDDRAPWKFWNIRDVRTISMIGKDVFGHTLKNKPFKGIKHNALDDAIHQAEYVCEVMKMIKTE